MEGFNLPMNAKRLLLSFFILSFLVADAWSSVREVPLDELESTREQRQSTLIILRVIEKYHYKKHHLDDAMSGAILDRYLEALDPNKFFFSKKDIQSFEVYRNYLDDALKSARLDPAFKIFKVFRQRVDERIAHALKLLDQEFDFSADETYRFDRSEMEWAVDAAALDEIWRKKTKSEVLSLRLKDKPEDEIKKTLKERYLGLQRRTRQVGSNDVYQSFINAYTLSLEPHTSFMSPRVAENFDISMRLSLEGIGAVLRNESEYTVVQRTVAGGPAALGGEVHAGDKILGVGQDRDGEIVDVIGWRLQDVVDLIRGSKGSIVRLRLLPEKEGSGGRSSVTTLVRNKIKLEDQAAKKSIVEGLNGMGPVRIGVIDLPAFYRDFRGMSEGEKDFRSTTRDVRKLTGELMDEGIDGLILDLRQNGGGSLVEATELTGLFIPSGPVVQVKNANGELDVEQDPDPALVYGGPLAVLVDRNSASASEIFAGAIQDYRRGIIIGEPTFGKGTVQTLVDLDRFVRKGGDKLGRLRLTMAQFFRVKGGSTQFRGVVPDILYPSVDSSKKHGERGLENALPWAQIKPTAFEIQGLGSLQKYRGQHQKRIENDPGFRYLKDQALLLNEVRERTTVSLVSKTRKTEWKVREERRKAQRNRFLVAIGKKPLSDEDEDKRSDSDQKDDPVAKIALNEAARILSDYIGDQIRSAMVQQ